jgi:predicted MPP superfamily phosphohydrolase
VHLYVLPTHKAALTTGQGMTKPIEFHAHDLIRYAGDILSWIHQACIAERDLLELLFGLKSTAGKFMLTLNPEDLSIYKI